VKAPSWLGPRRAAALAERFGTPFYAYSSRLLRSRSRALAKAFPSAAIRYAMKANGNPAVLEVVRRAGLGVDTVSPWEVLLAREVGFRKKQIIYSGNMPSDDDLAAVHREGVMINLDALSSLRRYGKLAPGAKVSLRVNLDVGGGHHPHVITAGSGSKFGLAPEELPEARAIAAAHKLRIVGLHQHIGSGIFELDLFLEALDPLLALLVDFPDLEFVDAGGGFGVPYRPDERPIDLEAWGRAVTERFEVAARRYGRPLQLMLEPGRYVVCEAGVLVARVTTVKRTRDRVFVGTDSGMHHLIRPALYQSYHPVATYPLRERAAERLFFTGPICESGDLLAEERAMPLPEEGDLVLVGNAGAYGYAMASHYNLRARPAEVMVDGDDWRLVREREVYRDVVRRRDVRRAK
jgi:diaminopimelate decarboxylase